MQKSLLKDHGLLKKTVLGTLHMGKGDFVVSVLSTPRRLLTVRARASVYFSCVCEHMTMF